MTINSTAPKIFISYSWQPLSNKLKVNSLAERLSSDGVHVIFDDWDLKEGHDKYPFMEQMVNDTNVKKVLLICNKEYAEKANAKKGGVGIESLIVSDEVYSKVEQTKFIPIVFEFDENRNAYLPTFLKSRIFIDLSNNDVFEASYEKLLRSIFDRPLSRRPPLGIMPSYLEIAEPVFLLTAHKVNTIKDSLISEKKNSQLLIQDYLDTFLKAIDYFEIKDEEVNKDNLDEIVLKKIDDMTSLRDDFVNFIYTYLSHSIEINMDMFHKFFESWLVKLKNDLNGLNSSTTLGYLKNDNIRFLYYELFLTFASIFIEKERFVELSYIFKNPFLIEQRGELLQLSFANIRQSIDTLNKYHNEKYSLNRVSFVSDTIKKRATDKIKFSKLVETDILLFYISLLFPRGKNDHFSWFPETSCYYNGMNTIFPKTASLRYFNKIKCIFNVDNKNELIEKVKKLGNSRIRDRYYNVPDVYDGLGIEKMCTLS